MQWHVRQWEPSIYGEANKTSYPFVELKNGLLFAIDVAMQNDQGYDGPRRNSYLTSVSHKVCNHDSRCAFINITHPTPRC